MKKIIWFLLLTFALCGCAIERSQKATAAQLSLIGRTKKHILECMGTPESKMKEENITIWSYHGDTESDTSGYGFSRLQGFSRLFNKTVNSRYTNYGFAHEHTAMRSCKISIVFHGNHVHRVIYTGRSGGVFTKNEACFNAIKNCQIRIAQK